MRRNVLLGLVISSGLSLLAAGAGCGDEATNTTGSGGAGGSGGASQSSSSSSVAQSSSTGTVADTNTSCDTAEELALDVVDLPATLDPVTEDKDYYVFEGTKGLAILLGSNAKPDADEFDTTYPDLVLTVKKKDANGAWVDIAVNDDPYPLPPSSNDSLLYTILPEDGTYCVEVTECNVLFPGSCADPDLIVDTNYTIVGGALNTQASAMGVQHETATEPAEVSATLDYENVQMGVLFRSLAWGSFADAADRDAWEFTIPMGLDVDAGARAACHFEFFYPGVEGNGSSAETNVTAYVVDAADPTKKIAEINPNTYDLTFGRPEPMNISVPCESGKTYHFVMERTMGAAAGANDFYFYNHYIISGNPVEVEPNDDSAMAEALKANMNDSGGMSHFVDGDIAIESDVDYFVVDVPQNAATISMACEAERGGSAIRGLKVTALNGDMPVTGGKGNQLEAANKQLFAYDLPVPMGATKITFKVEATSLDANIASHFYRCGFHLNPPAMMP